MFLLRVNVMLGFVSSILEDSHFGCESLKWNHIVMTGLL